jgi:hypothetical protein
MNLLSPDEFAARLPRRTPAWVRRELRAGRIRGSQINRQWYIPEAALTELMEAHSNESVAS